MESEKWKSHGYQHHEQQLAWCAWALTSITTIGIVTAVDIESRETKCTSLFRTGCRTGFVNISTHCWNKRRNFLDEAKITTKEDWIENRRIFYHTRTGTGIIRVTTPISWIRAKNISWNWEDNSIQIWFHTNSGIQNRPMHENTLKI